MSKHSALIIGDAFTAFIDGIPDTCSHDTLGGTHFQTESGRTITPTTYQKWASYTSIMRDELIYKLCHDKDDHITMAAVSCSKCGKPHFPNPMDFEI